MDPALHGGKTRAIQPLAGISYNRRRCGILSLRVLGGHPRSRSGRDHLDTERHQPHRPAGEPARAATQGGDDCRTDADNDGLAIDACGQRLQALTQLSEPGARRKVRIWPGAGQGGGCLADAWSGWLVRFESHRQSNTGPCSAARLCSSSQSFEPSSATYSRREPAS